MRPRLAAMACMMLAACGYHLAGQGQGAIPEDVRALSVIAADESARRVLPEIKQALAARSDRFVLVAPGEEDAQLRIDRIDEQFVPVSFDARGVDTVYRLSISGSLSLWRGTTRIWTSGPISVSEDIYAAYDPTTIEATRQRIRRDLMHKWLREAQLRLAAGG